VRRAEDRFGSRETVAEVSSRGGALELTIFCLVSVRGVMLHHRRLFCDEFHHLSNILEIMQLT
jgi:hypothetical protein